MDEYFCICPLFLKTLTPLHIGSGKGDIIDQEVIKDINGIPYIPGSSLKGVLKRHILNDPSLENLKNFIEYEIENKSETIPSKMCFLDAIPIFFIARDLESGYIYITTEYYLKNILEYFKITTKSRRYYNYHNFIDNLIQIFTKKINENKKIIVNEYEIEKYKRFNLVETENIDSSLIDILKRVIILPDTTESYYIIQRSMIVSPRVRLNDRLKIVEKTGVWYEEYIPRDSYFLSLILFKKYNESDNVYEKDLEKLNDYIINLGGKESIGKGFCEITITRWFDTL